jgi:hypothetical protein
VIRLQGKSLPGEQIEFGKYSKGGYVNIHQSFTQDNDGNIWEQLLSRKMWRHESYPFLTMEKGKPYFLHFSLIYFSTCFSFLSLTGQ